MSNVDRRSEPARTGGRNVDRRSELARTGGRNTESVWEVFARKAYEDPLHHVGTISEPDEDLALVSARAVYDEHPWIEMIIVPRSAIREAISA
jgi:1,2-phenylacetyl-CoA epoxidase PaaB subunit